MISLKNVTPLHSPVSPRADDKVSTQLSQASAQHSGADVYTPGDRPAANVDYSHQLSAERQWGPRFEALRAYVLNVLQEQGVDTEGLAGSRVEAAAAIADDGYWGVEQTASRIFEFAVAQAGGDVGRLQKIRDAIDKGYGQALEAMGGWLPEISQRTIERVHAQLDAWGKELSETKPEA